MNEKEKRMLKVLDDQVKKMQRIASGLDTDDVIIEEDKLCPGKLGQYYALLIYHSMHYADAYEIVKTKSYDEIDKLTHIDFFITAASEGIEKFLFKNGMRMKDLKEVVRDDGFAAYGERYLEAVGNYIKNSFNNDDISMIEQCLNAAEYIHNKRIQKNVIDDFYDSPSEEHKLLRELPFELVGLKEIKNYFTFLLPLIDKFKLPLMGFVASSESFYNEGCYDGNVHLMVDTEDLYSSRVSTFLKDNNIQCQDDLRKYLKNIANKFDPLKVENAPKFKKELAEHRLAYLTDDKVVDKLVNYLLEANSDMEETFKAFKRAKYNY